MQSLKKRMLLGFYFSLLFSTVIITIVSFWSFSYISRLYSIENSWNENAILWLSNVANSESMSKDQKDLKALRTLLDNTQKLPFIREKSISELKNSILVMQNSPLNSRTIVKSFEDFHSIVNAARNRALFILVILSLILTVFNILVLSFLIFRPQKYLLDFINTVSRDLNGLNVGRITGRMHSRYRETTNLVGAFNTLGEKFSMYQKILALTERSRTVDDLAEELYLSLNPLVEFDGIAFVNVRGDELKVETFVGDSKTRSVKLPMYVDIENSVSAEAMTSGKPKVINDFESHKKKHPKYGSIDIVLREGMRSGIIFPIYVEDLCIGFMMLFSRKRDHFSDGDIEKLEILGEFLSLAYQKTSMTHDLILSSTTGFTKLVEGKDNETGEHVHRMAEYSRRIAEELSKSPKYSGKIDSRYIKEIHEQALLHDIGKVGIPDSILLKPGKLTEDEFETIKKHTVIGHDILRKVDESSIFYGKKFFEMGSKIVRHHHEKWDGTGYPDGLRGDDIPLCARIVAVADVFDALTSRRPYKEPFDHDTAVEMIVNGSGTQFDPEIVKIFREVQNEMRKMHEKVKEKIAVR